jgi:hypothetical protein
MHRTGLIAMLPPKINDELTDSSGRDFLLMMQMFLEYHCGYDEICWSCGTSKIEDEGVAQDFAGIIRKTRYTRGNSLKWHYQCKCGEFWVRNHCWSCHKNLIKHVNDYHAHATDNRKWSVQCPNCGKPPKQNDTYDTAYSNRHTWAYKIGITPKNTDNNYDNNYEPPKGM